jgi:hypothetical protein
LASSHSWFVHSRETGRILGPFQKKESKGRTTLSGVWRRGITAGPGFYIRLNRKTTVLSSGQEKCLLADLATLNNHSPVPDVWRFGLSSNILRITSISHKPFRLREISSRTDPLRIKRATTEILSALLLLRRSGWDAGLPVLETAGRRLFHLMMKDHDLIRSLEEGNERPLLIVPDKSLQSIPFELMFSSRFLCLLRPLSRCSEGYVPSGVGTAADPKTFQIAFAGRADPPIAVAGLQELFRGFKHKIELRQATPRSLPGLLSRPGAFHFAGHGLVRNNSYYWQSTNRTVLLDPSAGRTPEFVFSHACNRVWFSHLFADFMSGLSRTGTDTWVGGWSDINLDSPAFCESFYDSALRGMSVGEAVLQARRHLMGQNIPDGLLFGCWGNPMKKITY